MPCGLLVDLSNCLSEVVPSEKVEPLREAQLLLSTYLSQDKEGVMTVFLIF